MLIIKAIRRFQPHLADKKILEGVNKTCSRSYTWWKRLETYTRTPVCCRTRASAPQSCRASPAPIKGLDIPIFMAPETPKTLRTKQTQCRVVADGQRPLLGGIYLGVWFELLEVRAGDI